MLRIEPSVSRQRKADRADIQLLRFQVFDGTWRIIIEAQSEDDAHYLCTEMGWELICCCEG